MNRRPADDVADYFSAVNWLRTAWTTLPVAPAKLHTRDIDGQLGQRYSAAFAKVLTGLGGWRTITVQDICWHPTLPVWCHDQRFNDAPFCQRKQTDPIHGMWYEGYESPHEYVGPNPFDCGDCQGTGLHLVQRDVHDHPMYVALAGLAKVPRPSNGTPSPIELVLALAYSGWDLDRAARAAGLPIVSDDHRETVRAMLLLSIRKLYGRFASGPVGRSESQARAEDAAWTT